MAFLYVCQSVGRKKFTFHSNLKKVIMDSDDHSSYEPLLANLP